MKKYIIMGVGALALVGVSVGASLFLTGALSKEPEVEAAEPAEELPEPVFYYDVKPEFVVNFQGKSRSKFLMIELVVATSDEQVLTILGDHNAELRNNLLLLLAEQDSEELKTAAGKETLRSDALERVEAVVTNHYEPEKVKDIFITRLVMQ